MGKLLHTFMAPDGLPAPMSAADFPKKFLPGQQKLFGDLQGISLMPNHYLPVCMEGNFLREEEKVTLLYKMCGKSPQAEEAFFPPAAYAKYTEGNGNGDGRD